MKIDMTSKSIFAFAAFLFVSAITAASAQDRKPAVEDLLKGKERPAQVPSNWVGSATKSMPGWRWDDPDNPDNSVRLFGGDPAAKDPTMREPFVVVVSNGIVIGRDGRPVPGAVPEE